MKNESAVEAYALMRTSETMLRVLEAPVTAHHSAEYLEGYRTAAMTVGILGMKRLGVDIDQYIDD